MPSCHICIREKPEGKKRNFTDKGLKIHKTRMHPFQAKEKVPTKIEIARTGGEPSAPGHGDPVDGGYLDMSGLPHEVSIVDHQPGDLPGTLSVPKTLSVQGDLIPTKDGHIALQVKAPREEKPGDVVVVGAGYRVVEKPSKWQRIKDFFKR